MRLRDPRLPIGADVGRLVTALYDVLRPIVAAVNNLSDSSVIRGHGSPEGVTPAAVGRLYVDRAGGKLYVKESGENTPTGWIQK